MIIIGECEINTTSTQNFEQQYIETLDKYYQENLGTKADHPALTPLYKQAPNQDLSITGKSYLMNNKMGFDIINSTESQTSWIIQDFIEFSASQVKPILDVGSGYGGIALKALNRGNTVIANDISTTQLINIGQFAQKENLPLDKLYLNNHIYPEDISFANESLSSVMLHRIIHFLTPKQIEIGLNKINNWLIPEGKVFIVVMSPFHNDYSDWFLPIYEQKWNNHDNWPGVNLEVEIALPKQAYNLPKYLHVMDERPLIRALEKFNFTIEKYDFVSLKSFATPNTNTRNGKESFGIIASKVNDN